MICVGSKLVAFTVSSKKRVKTSDVKLRSKPTKLGEVVSGVKDVTIMESFRDTGSIPFPFMSRIASPSKLRCVLSSAVAKHGSRLMLFKSFCVSWNVS